jgi:outer membrane protein assembly complex protein YaeT
MLFLSRALPGAPEDYRNLPIVRIAYKPVQQPLPPKELEAILPLKVGDKLDPAILREAIERLHATGRYLEIAVEAERSGDGVALQFVTKGTWFIGRITTDKVPEPPNRGQLASATKLHLGEEFTTELLRDATANLKAKLEANGFFEARIDPSVEYDEPHQQANLDFRINPGPRAKLTEPVVEGIPAEEATHLIGQTRWKYFGGFLGWRPLNETRVAQGLERIRRSLAKQDFLLSRVTLKSLDYSAATQRATPHVTIDRGPKVEIRASGAKLSGSRLRQLVPVFQEQSVDRDLLVEGQRNIQSFYQAQGYFQASVDFETQSLPNGRRAVTFHVERGTRYRLAKLGVTGNKYFPTETILERLSLQPATRIRYRYGRFNAGLLEADKSSIRELYGSNGFRDARVESVTTENHGGRGDSLAVTIKIQEGAQWFVAKQEFTGAAQEHRDYLETRLSSGEGQPFSEANLAQDRDTVLNYYYNRGYPNAKLDWVVTPAAAPNQVNVKFEVLEGPQQFVRGLMVDGLEATDPILVSRRIRLKENAPLSQALMVQSQRRLYDLGIFARVDMAVQNPEGDEQGKFLLYEFEEGRKYSLNFGIGAEIARIGGGLPNFDAPAGQPGFSPRVSFGVTRNNIFGTGHLVSGQMRLSNIQQRGLATYQAPQFKGRDDVSLTVSGLYDVSRDIRTFKSKRLEGALQLSKRLNRANTLQTRFTYRRNTVSDLAIDESFIPIYSQPVRVGVLSTTLFQDYRDDPIDSRRGYYNSVDFGYASKAFASQTDYFRLLAKNSTYHRVGRDIIFARSSTIGMLANLRNFGPAGIPLPERFFSGGASTHRGFPDNQAGPRDLSTGFPIGGSAVLINNLELRFPLYGENFGAVLFHDAGNVYTGVADISFRIHQKDPTDFNYMVHAVGLGFRYKTPVGPVRVDFAFPANSPRFSFTTTTNGIPLQMTQRINRFQFHFSLGQTF